MALAESKGIILFAKDYREQDQLVKIFTESAGKQMFLVKGAHRKNNPLKSAIQPFTQATYIGKFNTEGLSFLNSAKEVMPYRAIQEDIFLAAYATYLLGLTDAAIEDRVYDPNLYTFLSQALTMINEEKDPEVITNIYEVQILQRFGVAINWQQCAVCGQTQGRFDYSSRYSGVLCEAHWSCDSRRYHADSKAVHFLRLFSAITFKQVQTIQMKEETKQEIRRLLDAIYDEYVGIHLKSKKFIQEMKQWQSLLTAPKNKKSEHS